MRQIYHRSPRLFLLSLLVLSATSCATPERAARVEAEQAGPPAAFQKHTLALTRDALRLLKEDLIKNAVVPDNRVTLKIDPDRASCTAKCGGGTSLTCNNMQCGAVDGAGCWDEGTKGQPTFKLCVSVEPPPQ
ncbi:hypothetical protein [Nitrosospira briensis]|uniref:hypothetical protein n=1 Tax=Nitrosospira briensis TaxID=35799 RepID=UPI0008ED2C15|nr:hypothetical protein [Nitrosospira briensis]SFO19519.1 hypothetical protein SAMN05216332_10768 [Nitrosospira briensis]